MAVTYGILKAVEAAYGVTPSLWLAVAIIFGTIGCYAAIKVSE